MVQRPELCTQHEQADSACAVLSAEPVVAWMAVLAADDHGRAEVGDWGMPPVEREHQVGCRGRASRRSTRHETAFLPISADGLRQASVSLSTARQENRRSRVPHRALSIDGSRKAVYNGNQRWGWLVAGAARGLQNRWGVLLRRPWWVRLPSIPADRQGELRRLLLDAGVLDFRVDCAECRLYGLHCESGEPASLEYACMSARAVPPGAEDSPAEGW